MTGPLEGLRVVELAGIGPAPFAGMILGDLGADVVRVDRPHSSPEYGDSARDLINRSKRSIIIDLKHPHGVEAVLDLVGKADILLEGFRPGVAERLGVGPAACEAVNPQLIYGRMTGWGQSGPRSQEAGHDLNYLALTGALHAMGRAGGAPQIPLNLVGDFAGGSMYLVAGVLAALHERGLSGRGQVVDAAIVDGVANLSTMFWGLKAQGLWTDRRGENMIDTGRAYYDVYECADGRYVALGAIEQRFFDDFCRIIGINSEAFDRQDPARVPELRALIAGRFRTRTRDQWTEVFEGSDACVTPVLSFDESVEDAHMADRGAYTQSSGILQPAPAPRFDRTPAVVVKSPPSPGQQSREVLRDWGIADSDADALVASGVVRGH